MASYNCKEAKKEVQDKVTEEVMVEDNVEVIKFSMEPKSKSAVKGEVTFTQEGSTVMMTATFSGLSEGEHAIHLHEKADCSSADGKSSGGHWNPTAQPHGAWGDATGYHKGDIGNFKTNATGTATVTKTTDEWCIGCGDDTKDILGKAVIVHQGVDDFTSQPSGAAGARVSCTGIIE
jgi:Cu-Zn family superoxide dismutase